MINIISQKKIFGKHYLSSLNIRYKQTPSIWKRAFSPSHFRPNQSKNLIPGKKVTFLKKIIIKGKNEKFLPYYKVLQKQPLKPLYAVIERL